MPDYKAMRAEGRSIGKRRGKATAQIEENRRKQERKQQMEQRFRELADNKAAQQNEIAKSQYAQAQAEQANENQLVAASVTNGTMMEDGTYTDKHWNELAIKSLGGNVKDLTQEQIDAESARIAGGAQKGYTRKYSSNVAAQNLQKQLEYNEAVRERDGSRQFHGDGVDGAIARLGQKAGDALFGKEEELVAPTMQGQPQGNQFGFNEEYTGSVPSVSGDLGINSSQQVYLRDEDGEINTSTEHTVFLDNKGNRMISTSEGPVPYDGKYVGVADHNKSMADSTKGSGDGASLSDLKGAVNQDLLDKFDNTNKVLRLTKNITDLTNVKTAAVSTRLFATMKEEFGKEWTAIAGDEAARRTFVQERLADISEEQSNGEPVDPKTSAAIATVAGELDSKKLFLAYAVVRIQRGSGRFTGQELKTTMDAFKSNNLAYAISAVQDAQKEAMFDVKKTSKQIAAEAFVTEEFLNGRKYTKPDVLAAMESVKLDPETNEWNILIKPEHRERLGALILVVGNDGSLEIDKGDLVETPSNPTLSPEETIALEQSQGDLNE